LIAVLVGLRFRAGDSTNKERPRLRRPSLSTG
jgi:hypothetical protein